MKQKSINTQSPVLTASKLDIGYQKEKIIYPQIDLSIAPGQLICLLGQNGTGKSTLIKTLSGLLPPLNGQVRIYDRDIARIDPTERAKLLSIVLTDSIHHENLSILSIISLGRYPYTNWFGKLRAEDEKIIQKALKQVSLDEFAQRNFNEISDGEKQRVLIAKALAQDTPLIILDEPTAHLDLPNRIEIMSLLKKLSKEDGKTILLSTHDLDLALQTADKLWLMKEQETIVSGSPEDLVLKGNIEDCFFNKNLVFDIKTGSFKIDNKPKLSIDLTGKGIICHWTQKALDRNGYALDPSAEIKIKCHPTKMNWEVLTPGKSRSFKSIEDMMEFLQSLSVFR